jgi:hypothetical protein
MTGSGSFNADGVGCDGRHSIGGGGRAVTAGCTRGSMAACVAALDMIVWSGTERD